VPDRNVEELAVPLFAPLPLWPAGVRKATIALRVELWYNLDEMLERDALIRLCVMF
jgi:hypothetical protein